MVGLCQAHRHPHRDLGARLAECPEIIDLFEHATQLRPVQVKNPKPFARLDRDPVALTDFDAVNDRFEKVFGVRPIPETCLPPLYDLAIMRHTVAHHAARVRDVDRDRFRYWSVRAGRPINPPVAYLKKLQMFLYQVGRSFDVAIRNAIFSRSLSRHGSFGLQRAGLVHLIEVFDYFGHLLTQEPGDILPQPWATDYDQQLEAADRTAHQRLLALCFTDLNASFGLDPIWWTPALSQKRVERGPHVEDARET